MKRKWDQSNDIVQRKCVDEIITLVEELTDAEIGVIAAQDIIDAVLGNLAPDIYNAGVRDAKKVVLQKVADLEAEVDLLEQRS